jgi:hypothetical protein
VLRVPRRQGPEDREALLITARRVVEAMKACDAVPSAERSAHATKLLDAIDGGW